MPSFNIRRRDVLTLLSAGVVSGCVPFAKNSPFWGTIESGVRGGVDGSPNLSREYADSLPYASMLAWFDGSPKALLVLSEILGDSRLVWHSADRHAVTTLGSIVVSAIGFDRELRSTQIDGELKSNPLDMTGHRLARLLDLSIDGERHQVLLRSTFAVAGDEDIEILGRSYRLRRVVEKVSSDGRARFENEYWVEPATSRCWKSRQTIVPTVPPFNMEILKYPAL